MGFYLVLILTSTTILFPAPLGELAGPVNTQEHIRPEWYFFPIYRWLRLVPGKGTEIRPLPHPVLAGRSVGETTW